MTNSSSSGNSSDQQRSTQKTVVYCNGSFPEANTIAYSTANMNILTRVTRAVLLPSSTNLAAILEVLKWDVSIWFWKLKTTSPTIINPVYPMYAPLQISWYLLEQKVTFSIRFVPLCVSKIYYTDSLSRSLA